MEVLSRSDIEYIRESNCQQRSSGTNFLYSGESNFLEHGKQVAVSEMTHKVDEFAVNVAWPGKDSPGEDQGHGDRSPISKGIYKGVLGSEHMEDGQEIPYNFCDSQKINLNEQKQTTEPCIASKSLYPNADKIEGELQNRDCDGKSCPPEAEWLEQDETVALWVKWRGKWQAGIRCVRADCPLSTLKARPTHERKKYFVVFFPHTGNYSWADTLLVCSINEFPEPIAHRTHYQGLEEVRDLSLPRRFIMQKLAVGMVNISDRLHNEAVIESARKMTAWKEFAMEVSHCTDYSDLGKMLLKLQSMILQHYVDPVWLKHSFDSWAQGCHNAQSADSIEMLKEELVTAILWNEVQSLWNAPVQPELDSEWKIGKQEVTKCLSTSHPVAASRDVEQQYIDNSISMNFQISGKRPKLEVRRAEMHAAQGETSTSHKEQSQTNTDEIDIGFFNSQGLGNAITLVSESCKNRDFTERAASSEYPSNVDDRLDGVVVEVGKNEFIRTTEVEETPANGESGGTPFNTGNKYRQCLAFIEAKGRQCVRWANEGDAYCCVHLAARSLGKISKGEQTPPVDAPMCEGTTTHGTKCKHRSQNGTIFCKKHRLQNSQYLMDMEKPSSSPGNMLKRCYDQTISTTDFASCKEIMLVGEVQPPVQENPISAIGGENLDGKHSFFKESDPDIKGYNNAEFLCCIGSFPQNNGDLCLDHAKLHTLYCEKHLPSFLKRARNGKSRIISKEVFIGLLRNCVSREQKLHLHQACLLLHGFIKSVLTHRTTVPKENQLQGILFEASKDLCVGEFLMKLVSYEREKLRRLWDFDVDNDKPVSTGVEQPLLPPVAHQSSHNTQKTVKCNICSEAFPDDQVLGTHWMKIHRKEAQQLFRGYACSMCMNSFINKKDVENHVRERHGMQFFKQYIRFECIPCGSHFMNPEQLWLHVLSIHSMDFKIPTVTQQQSLSASQASRQLELGNNDAPENNSGSKGEFQRFICRFCGLKFDLLPDLGRHHQATHMYSNSNGRISSTSRTYFNSYKLKSGRLNHTSFAKGLGAASYRIRNRSKIRMKKHFQVSNSVSSTTQVAEVEVLGRLSDSQCSAVVKSLSTEIQKAKPRPGNDDILSIARSSCCKISLQSALVEQYGVLPERLYLKAAKLCSEVNIPVEWHQEGFICPKGCKPVIDPHSLTPLMPLPTDFKELPLATSAEPMNNGEWEMDECHYIIESCHIKAIPRQKVTVLCEDVSFGLESIPVICTVDEDLKDTLHIVLVEGSNGKRTVCPMPWESFTYVTKQFLDPSLGHDTESLQLGCACPHATCSPEACDHVYLFDNDYENAKDIYGKPMNGKFPYDEKGQMILEEGCLVYECNSLCSCDKTCRNRVLQNGVQVKLEIFKTEKKGWAVRACETISRGTFVCEYVGEVLNDWEANKRCHNEDCSYLYNIDSRIEGMSELTEGVVSYVIDATRYGNVSRFINHSCSPNLLSYQVLVDSMDCRLAHIGLYASRDIAVGEELAYDYCDKIVSGGRYPCHCGAPKCQGYLP